MDKKLKKALRRSAILAVFWLLILSITLTSATYAWFTFNTSAAVKPLQGSVSGGDGELLIANSAGGPFGPSCDLILSSMVAALEPISTADLLSFYEGTVQNPDGITLLYQPVTDPDRYAFHGTLFLRVQESDMDVYFWPNDLEITASGQVMAALRLGLRINSGGETRTYIFRVDNLADTSLAQSRRTVTAENVVVSAVNDRGVATLVADPAWNIREFFAAGTSDEPTAGTTPLCTVHPGSIASVEFWLYLEGCDDNCFNPVQSQDVTMRLSFAGV